MYLGRGGELFGTKRVSKHGAVQKIQRKRYNTVTIWLRSGRRKIIGVIIGQDVQLVWSSIALSLLPPSKDRPFLDQHHESGMPGHCYFTILDKGY